MDIVDLHQRACAEFATRVRTVRDDQWDSPTPCAEWDVRALVKHVVGEDRWTVPLIAGQTISQVGDRHCRHGYGVNRTPHRVVESAKAVGADSIDDLDVIRAGG